MSEDSQQNVGDIGRTAGVVWKYLNDNGSVSLTRLVKDLEQPRDRIMQAVGWLRAKTRSPFVSRNAVAWLD